MGAGQSWGQRRGRVPRAPHTLPGGSAAMGETSNADIA
ncbi:hypothetical protein EES41_13065 [Streptomyces sp. ADI95-16]|nr:hypothetical protein EES41_13065 [Streptomyces sp. ADI95-16]